MAQGLTHYFTGKICRRDHVAERFVSNKCCLKCLVENNAIYRDNAANREEKKAYDKEYRQRKDSAEKNRARAKAFYAANRELVKAKAKAERASKKKKK